MKGAEAVSNERVNVLATIRHHRDTHDSLAMSDAYSAEQATKLDAALKAVAELIEAQRKAHDAMLLADWNVPSLCSERKHAAYIASAAILSRIGGADDRTP